MLGNILSSFLAYIIVSRAEDQQQLEIIDIFDYASGIFAAVLFALTLIAYRNTKTTRLLFVSAAFALFSLRTLISRLDFFIPETQSITIELALSLSAFAILTLFFVAVVKR